MTSTDTDLACSPSALENLYYLRGLSRYPAIIKANICLVDSGTDSICCQPMLDVLGILVLFVCFLFLFFLTFICLFIYSPLLFSFLLGFESVTLESLKVFTISLQLKPAQERPSILKHLKNMVPIFQTVGNIFIIAHFKMPISLLISEMRILLSL